MCRRKALLVAVLFEIAVFNIASAQEITPLGRSDNAVEPRPAVVTPKTQSVLQPVQSNLKPCEKKQPPEWCKNK